jgi:ribonuclease HII
MGELRPRPLRPLATRPTRATAPTLTLERQLWQSGRDVVVGVDEVGRGSWAGPLMVAAAVLPRDRRVYGVRDSKLLSERERERLYSRVAAWCSAWAVGSATHAECDALGMAEAQRLAARRALGALGETPDAVLVDGSWDFVGLPGTLRVIRGDAACLSIAAASVLAKVTRDRLMRAEAVHFPGYDFDANKGYPCPRHQAALHAYGPTAIHRRSWVFMERLAWGVPGSRAPAQPRAEPEGEAPGRLPP